MVTVPCEEIAAELVLDLPDVVRIVDMVETSVSMLVINVVDGGTETLLLSVVVLDSVVSLLDSNNADEEVVLCELEVGVAVSCKVGNDVDRAVVLSVDC